MLNTGFWIELCFEFEQAVDELRETNLLSLFEAPEEAFKDNKLVYYARLNTTFEVYLQLKNTPLLDRVLLKC